jgi:mannitol-1-/sugar-/sorbitol-6-phosphatase
MPILRVQAILFDLDGVLVDSIRAIELVWRRWGAHHGLDGAAIARVAHGRRTSETIAEVAPDLDPATEVGLLDRMEEEQIEGVSPVPGAAARVEALPPERWAIVTSGSPAVAALRLRMGGIPRPRHLITAHDVCRGKPAPEGYLLAASRLGAPPDRCLVVEDAPAGVAAGKAAGMRVVGLLGTHTADRLAEADWLAPGLESLQVGARADGLHITLKL